jgi:hypothetical protein
MTKFVLRLVLLIVALLPFMDDASSRRNRMIDRMNNGQLYEAIFTINNLIKPIHG